jgi:glycine cleavage system H protein
MKIPKELQYTAEHEWVKLDGNVATIGVTDFAQGELGDIVYVEVDTIGQTIAQGEVFGTVEAVKTVSDLFMPVSGKILELNPELASAPDKVNSEPYDGGWIIKVQVDNVSELSSLMSPEAYESQVAH